LAQAVAPYGLSVRPVPIAGGLHLKSLVTLVKPGLVVVAAGSGDVLLPVLAEMQQQCLLVDEPEGANVLALGAVVLVSTAAPRTFARLSALPGLRPIAVEVSEFHRADGALTCLSLRLPPPGNWCA
ncbi:MAG: hypothetical protein CVV27_07295, partial [Candidatus Melainabacteria bacterium HGW-Melainabacteria-1]